jgi:acetyl-CoA carboxylase carboxyl transferase subunit alpha
MGIGDVIAMLEHSYYSVISPEGCASILWKDTSKNEVAAQALKMHVEDLIELGVVDMAIKEPAGGAHHDVQVVYKNVKTFIAEQWDLLKTIPTDTLLERRYQKFRRMGKFAVEDKAALV